MTELTAELLGEIDAEIPSVTDWVLQPGIENDETHDARVWKGHGPHGWVFTVISFSIEDQGFPPGSRGVTGAARKENVVMHLTRELADKAIKLAEEKQKGSET